MVSPEKNLRNPSEPETVQLSVCSSACRPGNPKNHVMVSSVRMTGDRAAQWVAVRTYGYVPPRPPVPMTRRRTLRHNAIEAWETMQKTGRRSCPPPVRGERGRSWLRETRLMHFHSPTRLQSCTCQTNYGSSENASRQVVMLSDCYFCYGSKLLLMRLFGVG